jgi:hypothetical protein
MTQRNVCPSRLFRATEANRPIELPRVETFAGSRLLATHRAARLSRGRGAAAGRLPWCSVRSTRGLFATLPCSFLILQALWRFWVTRRRRRPRIRASRVLEYRSPCVPSELHPRSGLGVL